MSSEAPPAATAPAAADARDEIRFDLFATGILYALSFALGAMSRAQIDLWWLLRAGRDIWHTGRVPLADHYSHTADGQYWPNHEWLWEAIAYALHQIGGMPVLSAWTGATVAGTVWVMRRNSRAAGYVVPLVLGAALPVMSVSWTLRPQVTSMLFFAVTMLLVGREQYAWIPPLFLVWANVHAQVVMGGVLLAFALAGALVDVARHRTRTVRRRAVRLGVATAASAAVTLATPLGPRLWAYVLDANGRPGQDRIAEWASAFQSGIGAAIFWPVLAVVLVLAVRRRERLADWQARVTLLATLAMAPLAMLAIRNIAFFLVAAVPLLMTLLEFRLPTPIGTVRHWRGALAGFAAVAAAAVVVVWVVQPPRLAWHPVPPALATALRHCPGPLYNTYDEGAAVVWFVPDVKVFVDNRQDPYPASVINASMGLRPEDYRRTFDRFGIQCALLARDSALTPALQHDGWTSTYDDGASVVLVPPRATSATE